MSVFGDFLRRVLRRAHEENIASLETEAILKRSMFRVDYACGHRDASDYELILFGARVRPTMSSLKRRELCGPCALERLKKESTRCRICHKLIMPGDPVTLYGTETVGCLRLGCFSGDIPAGRLGARNFSEGRWTPNGINKEEFT
jgi:hypothetical protein